MRRVLSIDAADDGILPLQVTPFYLKFRGWVCASLLTGFVGRAPVCAANARWPSDVIISSPSPAQA